MLAMEEILFELSGDIDRNEQGLPPGFRFHPTDEELITFYLASKVFNGSFCGVEIAEVDLNRCEPWELPDMARMGEREWYFFSLRDRKYPTGLRTNRATGAGYWKATGKDREVYSASSGSLLGMKKTLVFYKGRAPRGEKTKWVMHEYRLDGDFSYRQTCKEEWVICRIFHKMTEKKNPLLQGSSYMLKNCSSPNTGGSLPPLLETSTTTTKTTLMESHYQNPFLQIHQQESDLKSLISTPLQIINGSFEPSFSATSNSIATPTNKGIGSIMNNNNNDSSSTSIIFKSLISSHQDFTNLKELANTISKQCKTEASFLQHCQLSAVAADHHHHQQQQSSTFQNPTLSFGMMMDCNGGVIGGINASTSSATLMDTVHEMSTSVALTSTAGFQQMLLDTPIKVTADSWPLDL